jgi:hypothetical protein
VSRRTRYIAFSRSPPATGRWPDSGACCRPAVRRRPAAAKGGGRHVERAHSVRALVRWTTPLGPGIPRHAPGKPVGAFYGRRNPLPRPSNPLPPALPRPGFRAITSSNNTPFSIQGRARCSQPRKPAPKWPEPTLNSQPKSHNHCDEVLGAFRSLGRPWLPLVLRPPHAAAEDDQRPGFEQDAVAGRGLRSIGPSAPRTSDSRKLTASSGAAANAPMFIEALYDAGNSMHKANPDSASKQLDMKFNHPNSYRAAPTIYSCAGSSTFSG